MHDLMQGPTGGPLHMQVPWADSEDETLLADAAELRCLLSVSSFRERLWQDRTRDDYHLL